MHAELTLGQGIIVGHGTVELLIRRAGIKGLPGTRPRPKHQTPTAVDLAHRQFAVNSPLPDRLWVTDITEHPTREGKVYCAVVLDTWSGAWWAGPSTARRSLSWLVSHNGNCAVAVGPFAVGPLIELAQGQLIEPRQLWPARFDPLPSVADVSSVSGVTPSRLRSRRSLYNFE